MSYRILYFRGIKFFDNNYKYIIKNLLTNTGYLVIPAASSLSRINKSKLYHNALKKSTLAIFDSGFFCFCLLFLKLKFFRKFSGYKFFNYFLNDHTLKSKKILSLDPTFKDSNKNYFLLRSKKFKLVKNYVCPIYSINKLYDKKLINLINKYRPEIIITNIAGGIQEPLALYIKNNINYKTSIICSGAAIAFFTGRQAPINNIIDNLYLGWLVRIIYNPKMTIRVLMSLRLIKIVMSEKIILL